MAWAKSQGSQLWLLCTGPALSDGAEVCSYCEMVSRVRVTYTGKVVAKVMIAKVVSVVVVVV